MTDIIYEKILEAIRNPAPLPKGVVLLPKGAIKIMVCKHWVDSRVWEAHEEEAQRKIAQDCAVHVVKNGLKADEFTGVACYEDASEFRSVKHHFVFFRSDLFSFPVTPE